MEHQLRECQQRQQLRGFPAGQCPAVEDEHLGAVDNSVEMVNAGRHSLPGISPLAALGKPLRPAIATCNSTRSATAPLCQQDTPQFRPFGRTRRGMSERSYLSAPAYLFSMFTSSQPPGRSDGASERCSCPLSDAHSSTRPETTGHAQFQGRSSAPHYSSPQPLTLLARLQL